MAEVEIRHNLPGHRFEAGSEPDMARLDYRIRGNTVHLIHTEVPEHLQSEGLGGRLARTALEWARDAGLKVVPTCPFVADYIHKHQEFASLL
jgi:predicted GNAT family acetyltransferase